MRRKVKVLGIVGCLLLCMAFTGCGLMEQTRQAAMASRDKMAEEASGGSVYSEDGHQGDERQSDGNREDNPKRDERQEDGEQEEEQNDEDQDDKSIKRKNVDGHPVLGGEEVEGYQGFDYLFETVLTAYMDEDVESGRKKRKSVTVYVPMGNEIRINGDFPGTVNSDTQGISFYADVNPGITFPKEDVSVGEKLESYIEHIYGGQDEEYEGRNEVEMSGIHRIGKDAAVSTVVQYWRPKGEEDYRISYITYYMKELEPGWLFFMEVEIDSSQATYETPEILKELEAFYEVEIPWDIDEAEEKLESYSARKAKEEAVVLPGIDFSFPENWERDKSYSDEEVAIYAPGGDCDGAGCGIGVACLLSGEDGELDDIWGWLIDDEYFETAITEGLEEVEGMEISYYGETCIGETTLAKFSCLSEGERTDCQFYLGEKNGNVYFVFGMQYQWLEMDTFELVKELLESGETTEE